MPMFTMKLTINREMLDNLHAMPERAARLMRQRIVSDLKPDVQEQMKSLLPLDPGTPSEPFEFGSDKSKAYYHWLVDRIDGLSDGTHWIRTGEIDEGFDVETSGRLQMTLLRVVNRHPKAKYLFGPWIVAGHAKTGWPDEANVLRDLLRDYTIGQLRQMWRQAGHDAAQGKG